MRRVVVASSFLPPHIGGVEFFVNWIQQTLPERGWDVQVVGCEGSGDLVWPVAPWRPVNIPLPLPSRTAAAHLQSLFRGADAALIQNFFYPFSSLAALAAARACCPALTVVHGNALAPVDASILVRTLGRAQAGTLGRWQMRRTSPVVVSESAHDFVKRQFGCSAPVLPLPLPQMPHPTAVTERNEDEPFRIVFVGRLVSLKDPLGALRAAMEVARARSVSMDFYGDGPLRNQLEAVAPDWVTVRGNQERLSMWEAIKSADCFVNSSITDSGPSSLLEALALGVPSVSTDVGDAGVYLRGDLQACVVPPRDIEALARRIDAVAEDWPKYRRLAVQRSSELRAKHSSHAIADELVRLLDSVVSGELAQ